MPNLRNCYQNYNIAVNTSTYLNELELEVHAGDIGLQWGAEQCAHCSNGIVHCPTGALHYVGMDSVTVNFN